jgi:hypothetical protein
MRNFLYGVCVGMGLISVGQAIFHQPTPKPESVKYEAEAYITVHGPDGRSYVASYDDLPCSVPGGFAVDPYAQVGPYRIKFGVAIVPKPDDEK